MTSNGAAALRASLGEMIFADDVNASMRATIREMWVNRLAGFRQRNLTRYLRDNVDGSCFVVYGKSWSLDAFRRFNRVLFLFRRLCDPMGVSVEAEAVDVRVTREGTRYVARGWLVLSLSRHLFRQSRLTMPIVRDGDRWTWGTVIDERVPRRRWRYASRKNGKAELCYTLRTDSATQEAPST